MQLVDTILTQTAEVFQRTPAELVGRSRKRPIVAARQAAMWAIRQRYPSLSLEVIGSALGGRHYSTVMHGLAAVRVSMLGHDLADMFDTFRDSRGSKKEVVWRNDGRAPAECTAFAP